MRWSKKVRDMGKKLDGSKMWSLCSQSSSRGGASHLSSEEVASGGLLSSGIFTQKRT